MFRSLAHKFHDFKNIKRCISTSPVIADEDIEQIIIFGDIALRTSKFESFIMSMNLQHSKELSDLLFENHHIQLRYLEEIREMEKEKAKIHHLYQNELSDQQKEIYELQNKLMKKTAELQYLTGDLEFCAKKLMNDTDE
eukprot:gene3151-5467_t